MAISYFQTVYHRRLDVFFAQFWEKIQQSDLQLMNFLNTLGFTLSSILRYQVDLSVGL